MTLNEKLHTMQKELKVPKEQSNNFGKYKYRNCEDIVEAVKKIIPEGCYLNLSDKVELYGEHVYIVTTAALNDGKHVIEAQGCAREALTAPGMAPGQMTGTASSYARKYALNGLFAIDDTKDADTNEYKRETTVPPAPAPVTDHKNMVDRLKVAVNKFEIAKELLAWEKDSKVYDARANLPSELGKEVDEVVKKKHLALAPVASPSSLTKSG